MVQIGDALAEDRTARVNTHIGTGQTVMHPGARLGILGGISVLGSSRRERRGEGAN
jgi:cobalamin biosynthesis protein CbiD